MKLILRDEINMKYDFERIEKKWQAKWEESKPYAAVMDKGVLQQYATPDEITANPANAYVERLVQRANEK